MLIVNPCGICAAPQMALDMQRWSHGDSTQEGPGMFCKSLAVSGQLWTALDSSGRLEGPHGFSKALDGPGQVNPAGLRILKRSDRLIVLRLNVPNHKTTIIVQFAMGAILLFIVFGNVSQQEP